MDAATVSYYLNDLPATFKRRGPNYDAWMASLGAGIASWTQAADAVMGQIDFSTAQWGWLDTWGQLFGLPRLAQESDAQYRPRIQGLMQLRGGPPNAIRQFMVLLYNTQVSITEDFTDVKWLLKLTTPVLGTTFNALAASLGVVRPAGVPFTPFNIAAGGNYIGTVNFIGGCRVPGSWLNTATVPQNFSLSAGTPNSVPLLPVSYLMDPVLNPALGVPPTPAPIAALSTPNSAPPGQLVLGSDAYTNFTIVTTSPNGALGGGLNDKAFNTADRVLYICTTAGDASTAVWTPVNEAIGEQP
jgi:hypothetical protein